MKELLGMGLLFLLIVAATKPEAIGLWWNKVESGFHLTPTGDTP